MFEKKLIMCVGQLMTSPHWFQIQKIYSGEITNWKEVGGDDEKICDIIATIGGNDYLII